MNKKLFLTLALCFCLASLKAEEFYDGTIDQPLEEENPIGEPSASDSAPPVENKDISNDQAGDRLSQLEEQMRALRGKLEELQHEVKILSQNTRDLSEEEIKPQIHRKPPISKEEENRGSSLKTGPVLQQYEEAQEYLAQQAYPEAERALKDIIRHYPADPLVINAQYWLGETYYIQKDYGRAAVAFGDAYKAYRKLIQSDHAKNGEARKISFAKAPEALVKLALSLKALGKNTQACVTLDELRSEFPRLPHNVKKLAEMAEQGLQQCKKTGKE